MKKKDILMTIYDELQKAVFLECWVKQEKRQSLLPTPAGCNKAWCWKNHPSMGASLKSQKLANHQTATLELGFEPQNIQAHDQIPLFPLFWSCVCQQSLKCLKKGMQSWMSLGPGLQTASVVKIEATI